MKNWQNRCQKCGKIDETTCTREITTKLYEGPCGDSFCYASCDLEACRPIVATVCDNCERELKK